MNRFSVFRPSTIARAVVFALPMVVASHGVQAQAGKAAPAAAPAAAQPAAQDKPIAVNGKVISKAKMEAVVRQRVAQGQADNEQLRRGILEVLINQEVLSQEAERRGLVKSPDTQVQLDLARQGTLANLLVEEHMRGNPIKDETARAEYEKIKVQRGTREYRARHILLDSEAAAKQALARLQKGDKFEEVAKESKDPGTRDRGGDLDWASPANFVKPFSDAMIKLEKGKYTEAPVQTQFGWHIIRLDDSRSTQFPPYDQVKPQIVNGLQQQEIQKFLGELRAKAKIDVQ